ncbi:hypothetical protein CK203_097412 [Vitis vinifera]|uniref:EF-hand domain-containing protein n=1 Tax=Vitis vinifera TaxID=29760 RepID=A0A438D9C1_VITVI|nr:hypothetical protein CK203_097412 [Vitis vinifera]
MASEGSSYLFLRFSSKGRSTCHDYGSKGRMESSQGLGVVIPVGEAAKGSNLPEFAVAKLVSGRTTWAWLPCALPWCKLSGRGCLVHYPGSGYVYSSKSDVCLGKFCLFNGYATYAQIHYDRIGEDGFFSHKEVTVLFVPDLSGCLPSLDTWRDQWLAHKKAVAERTCQLSLKREKSKEKKEGLKDKEIDSTKAVKQVDKSAKTKDSASSGQADVNKKEKMGVNQKSGWQNYREKESGGTAGSQTSGNAKSGKKKLVKKVVKQKVADKKAGTENTENEENDKLDDKDVGEKNAKLETKSQQQEPSADPRCQNFYKEKSWEKDKSEIKSDPSIAASVQGTGVKTTIKKKIIKRIPKRKVTGVGTNIASAESKKDDDNDEKKVVQQGTETKDVSEQKVEAGNPVCEPKILEKKMTPKTKSKTATFSKQDEKTGSGTKVEIKSKTANFSKQDEKIVSGTKVEIEAEKQKVPQKDSQNGNRDKSKDQEKLKDEKEKKEKDGKYDSRGNKPDKEAKEKKNLEEPPRHPGLLLQTKWSKDSKLRSLSLSLDSLLGYTDKDIEEPTFELSLFAETLYEMLQYQMGCRLLTFLQLIQMMKNLQPRARVHLLMWGGKGQWDTEPEKVAGMGKEEAEEFGKEKTNNKTSGTNEGTNLGEERKEAPIINKVAVDKELLQAFRFFDRNRVGYIRVEDMRLIVHNLGNFLSHRDVKFAASELVQSALLESNTGRDDRILYNKLELASSFITERLRLKVTDFQPKLLAY